MSEEFQLSLPGFDGPVDALPPLVASHRLSIDDIPLAEIPAQFLAETGRRDAIDLVQAGEVVATVARLMLLKSAQLLLEPQEEVDDIPEQRHADTAFVQAALPQIAARQGFESLPSPRRLTSTMRASEPRSPLLLRRAWEGMRQREGRRLSSAHVAPFIRIEVALDALVTRLKGSGQVSLRRLIRRARRRDAVIHFLAALELVRAGRAIATQEGIFGDITLRWMEDRGERRRRAG